MKTFENAKVGDKVYCLKHGKGIIINIGSIQSHNYPLGVKFDYNSTYSYTLDGKSLTADKNPILYWSKPEIIAPEAPKRMVIKTISRWINIYSDGIGVYIYDTQLEATKHNAIARGNSKAVEFIITYEVEE